MRRLLITIVISCTGFGTVAQTSVSFYHLGNTTFQNSDLNPAWIPKDSQWLIGLPVISGIHINANSKLSYNDVFTKETEQVTVDGDKLLSRLQNQNMLSTSSTISLFHLGRKTNNGSMISFFVNERIEADLLFPKDAVEMVRYGNNLFLNEEVKLGKIGFRANHFREIGIGYAFSANEFLDIGIRTKYLTGFFDASTPGNMQADLTTSGEFFQLYGELQNVEFRTSGLNIYDDDETEGDLGSHLLFNGNSGVALDLGFNYRINRNYSFAGSILDIGFIGWNEDVENHALDLSTEIYEDDAFDYSGVDLDQIGNPRNVLYDSLFRQFKTTTNNENYTTQLPLRAYGSLIFHYNPKMNVYGTMGTRILHGQVKMLYAGGLSYKLRKVLNGSITVVKLPQQFFNLGAAVSLNGPVQFYLAADQIINFSAPDAKALDFRMGLNFRIRANSGDGEKDKFNKAKGIDTNQFLGNYVRTKRREGIYSIITRQKRRKAQTGLMRSKKARQRTLIRK